MQPIGQLLSIVEGQKKSMEHFVEHMGVIFNNVEDSLTKELLSHLIEEEHERVGQVEELIQALRGWQADGSGSQAAEIGRTNGSVSKDTAGLQSDGRRTLTIGSLIQY